MDEENQSQTENQNSSPGEKSGKFNTTVVAVVIAVLVIALGIFLMTRSANNGSQSADLDTTQQEEISQTESSPTSKDLGTDQTAEDSQTISVEGGGFYFKPNLIKAKIGQKVTIVFNSVGGNHDFVIDDLDVKTPLTAAGKSAKVEFTPEKAGSFEFYCSVGNHRAQGMKGTLVVK